MKEINYFNESELDDYILTQCEMIAKQARPILNQLTLCRIRRQSLPRFVLTENEAHRKEELNAIEAYMLSQLHALLGYDDENKRFIF